MFVAIGHDPTSSLFRGQFELDDAGFISIKDRSARTYVLARGCMLGTYERS